MGAIKLVTTLIAGVVFAILILVAAKFFEEDKEKWLKATIGACLFFATNLIAPIAPAWLGLLSVILPFGCLAYLFIWWAENGSTGKELAIFLLMGVMLYFVEMAAVARVLDLSDNWVLRGFVMSFPKVVNIIFVAFMVSNMIEFRQRLNSLEGGEEYDEE